MAKRNYSQKRDKTDISSDTQRKSGIGGRRPPRHRNRDDEILDHHWEVVYDDSPGGHRDFKKKHKHPRQETKTKSDRKDAVREEQVEKDLSSKEVVGKKKRRRGKKKPAAVGQDNKQEQKPAPETPAGEARPVESGEPTAKKKKRPARKRRKKRPAESKPESTAERPQEDSFQTPQEKPLAAEAPRAGVEEVGFWEMPLLPATRAALRAADYLEPTPVQAGFIPKAMLGNDLMAQARTGTGKTAAFAIPIIELHDAAQKRRGPHALVLVPTRELAVQVRDEFARLAMGSKVRIVAVYGGKPIRQQMEKLGRGAEVVVGTPGRVMDHMGRGTLFLGDLRIVVLDEADRMLDIGFRPDIEKILRQCPQSRQTFLLSATIPPPVKRLAERYMRDPEMLDFSPHDVAVETIEQFYFTVDATRKFDLLVQLLQREQPRQAIIFCRTRRGTERIYQRLSKKETGAACIHGDLPQRTRDRVMSDFRAGKIRLLLATDVVGRGIDVSGISHIINFDTPEFCDDYVHRVGRTGRMGREGIAFSFVTPEEGNELTRIEMRINRLLKRDEIAGFSAEPLPAEVAQVESAEAKPVFGRRERRIRRAL